MWVRQVSPIGTIFGVWIGGEPDQTLVLQPFGLGWPPQSLKWRVENLFLFVARPKR
jgi:hypothetical protein